MYYGYKITNTINNKYYIGVHAGEPDDNYPGSGKLLIQSYVKRIGPKFSWNDIWKSGIYKKEILAEFNNIDEMYEWEASVVTQELVDDPMCYNIQLGGRGGFHGCHTPESIERQRASRERSGNLYTGYNAMIRTAVEHAHTPEALRKMVETKKMKGNLNNGPDAMNSKESRAKRQATFKESGGLDRFINSAHTPEVIERSNRTRNIKYKWYFNDELVYIGRKASATKMMRFRKQIWIKGERVD